ncbi:MAG: hypothetical protein ABIF87_14835 [Pseudomonadota bacterium]
MAEKRNWDSVRKHGLLSTTALLDLFEYKGRDRFEIESQLRLREYCITHPAHGVAFIRDQDPMRDRPGDGVSLEKCLVDVTPQQWFEILNRRTFFWTDLTGLGYMLGAKLYRNKSHYVITVDSRELLRCHADKVSLSGMNSGSLYGQKKRSADTFKPISEHKVPWVTELAVDYSVPDITELMTSVEECICQRNNRQPSRKILKRIWP